MPHTTPEKVDKLLKFLRQIDVNVTVHNHAPVFTVAEAQSLRGSISGAHTKNLFLRDRKNNIFLVTALEDAFVDLKTLHARIGASSRLSFANAGLLADVLGVEPGAVSPFGLVNDTAKQCNFVLDQAILGYDIANFHPLDNTMTVSISPEGLHRFLSATGHSPVLLEFPPAQTAAGK
jgi:Ala-tRNA(Pro) deacylase